MARNEEKAQAMLNRWVNMKRQLHAPTERRPQLAAQCDSINDCEKWRGQIIKEISKKVQEIQNAGLGEHKIRDLNDDINRLIKEKGHWEDRIKELGGADYKNFGPKVLDSQGMELPGSGGYKYFGAAKDLPGVRELFQADVPNAPKKSRADLYKNINYEYYGLRDDENTEMLKEEAEYEKKLYEKTLENWIDENTEFIKEKLKKVANPTRQQILDLVDDESYDEFKKKHQTTEALYKNYKTETQEDEVTKQLELRRKALLEQYFPKEEEDNETYITKKITMSTEDRV